MRCLFGLMDCQHRLTAKQKNHIITALSVAAEARGRDAAGIAYNSGGKLRIYKRPLPAQRMHFRVPEDAAVIMGHTRMATQGAARKNRNNHPFIGQVGGTDFALAHNGVLWNDRYLRCSRDLPATKTETGSYVAGRFRLWLSGKHANQIKLDCGGILKIGADGTLSRDRFACSGLLGWYENPWLFCPTGTVDARSRKRTRIWRNCGP